MAHNTSARFKKSILHRHVAATYARLITPRGQPYSVIQELPIDEGYVTVERENAIRNKMYINMPALPELIPHANQLGRISPFSGNRVELGKGIDYGDGTKEIIHLGTFDIAKVNTNDSKENFFIRLDGYDRSRNLRRRRFKSNYMVPPGILYTDAIKDIITYKDPLAEFRFSEFPFVTPMNLVFGGAGETGGGNSWDSAIKMAKSIGCDLYVNHHDEYVLEPVPTIFGEVSRTYQDDPDNSVMLFLTRIIDDEDARSTMVVFGENTDEGDPIVVEVKNENPLSPTSVQNIGEIPGFFRTDLVTSEEQGQQLGEALLREREGATETVQFMITPDPSMEIGDIIRVTRPRSNVNKRFTVDSYTMTMGTQQGVTIKIRSVDETSGE